MTFDCGLSLKTKVVEENYLSKSVVMTHGDRIRQKLPTLRVYETEIN